MSTEPVPNSAAADWVGCVALVIGSARYADPRAAGLAFAQTKLLRDAVLGGLARVNGCAEVDPFTEDADDVAAVLQRELLDAALAPDADAAPRITFCVLVVDPDGHEAQQVVRDLAATTAMSRLPVRFPVVTFAPDSADHRTAVAEGIVEAVDATAHQVAREPRYSLTRGQLRKLADPSRPVAVREDSDVDRLPVPWTAASPDRTPTVVAPRDGDAVQEDCGGVVAGLRDVVAAVRSRLPQRSTPLSNVEVIEQLSSRAGAVPMLYLVTVSEPVRPPRALRERRTAVALELISALDSATGTEPWHVRVFTADRQLHPAPPLPRAGQVRRKHIPEKWGVHFELFECVDDILERIGQESASFVRRGGRRPEAFVVFLADTRLSVSSDLDRSLARLAGSATTVWVSFEQPHTAATAERDGRLHILSDHEDLVDQLTRLLLSQAAVEPR